MSQNISQLTPMFRKQWNAANPRMAQLYTPLNIPWNVFLCCCFFPRCQNVSSLALFCIARTMACERGADRHRDKEGEKKRERARREKRGLERARRPWQLGQSKSRNPVCHRCFGAPPGTAAPGLIAAALSRSTLPLSLFIFPAISYSSNRQNI